MDVEQYYRTIAPFYDAEVADRGDEAAWCEVARELAGQLVLDLGCGTGRASALLHRFGARVIGLDLSDEMLLGARQRLGADASLLRGDMRALPVRRASLDAVIAANDPFVHLTDDSDRERAVAGAATALRPGGWLALDPMTARARGHTGERVVEYRGRRLRIAERWDGDHATYRYELDGGIVAEATFRARAWSPGELEGRLKRHGLTVERRDPIVVARRSAGLD